MYMLTSQNQTLARCRMLLLPKKHKAFREQEQEQGGHWLRLQTRAWLLPCALLPVASGTYLGSQCFGVRVLFLLGGFAGILASKQSLWMVW